MWYAILIILLIIEAIKSFFRKIQFSAYVGFMVENDVTQPTESEMKEWILWAAKNTIHDFTHKLSRSR